VPEARTPPLSRRSRARDMVVPRPALIWAHFSYIHRDYVLLEVDIQFFYIVYFREIHHCPYFHSGVCATVYGFSVSFQRILALREPTHPTVVATVAHYDGAPPYPPHW
jgi:hypothetical protein